MPMLIASTKLARLSFSAIDSEIRASPVAAHPKGGHIQGERAEIGRDVIHLQILELHGKMKEYTHVEVGAM